MANTLAGVLPTPRIVPSMSAMFQRDSQCSRSRGGDIHRIGRTPGDMGAQQEQSVVVTGETWSPLHAEGPEVPGKKAAADGYHSGPTRTEHHLTAGHWLPTPKHHWAGLQPGPRAGQLGFGSPTR